MIQRLSSLDLVLETRCTASLDHGTITVCPSYGIARLARGSRSSIAGRRQYWADDWTQRSCPLSRCSGISNQYQPWDISLPAYGCQKYQLSRTHRCLVGRRCLLSQMTHVETCWSFASAVIPTDKRSASLTAILQRPR